MEAIAVANTTSDVSEVTTIHASSSPAIVHVSFPSSQSVIHSAPSVIQTASGQTIQVASVASDGDTGSADEDLDPNRKRRELLARRPSYRKILNELSSPEGPQMVTLAKVEEDSNSSHSSGGEESDQPTNLSTSGSGSVQYASGVTVVPASALQLTGDGSGIQTLTMTNDTVKAASSAAPQGATIVQYAQGPDGQFFIPGSPSQHGFKVSNIATGNVQYQLAPQGVVMATAGTGLSSQQNVPEEASRKRELRLLKNREAARECRRKKKEYVKCLENRVAVLENQNKTLIEELKSLKELYCQKEAQS